MQSKGLTGLELRTTAFGLAGLYNAFFLCVLMSQHHGLQKTIILDFAKKSERESGQTIAVDASTIITIMEGGVW